MKVFGLTGGIGMGKSTSATLLAARGLPVIDTDDLARQLVKPGQPALKEIENAFGVEMLDSTGQLKRDYLAQKVFADINALRRLESILHPRIQQRWKAEVINWRKQRQNVAIVVIPLLFETNAQSEFDTVICVACSTTTQLKRLRERGWSDEQIQQRLASQWSIGKKIEQSDVVVWTDTTLEVHTEQLKQILSSLLITPA